MAVGGLVDLGDYVRQLDVCVFGAKRATVDEHMLFVAARIEREQKAVAEALPVHANTQLGQITVRLCAYCGGGLLLAYYLRTPSGRRARDAPCRRLRFLAVFSRNIC